MANPIVKSKATDFSGYYDAGAFYEDVLALGLSVNLVSLVTKLDVIEAHFSAMPSGADETSFDTSVSDHALSSAKQVKCRAIDKKTEDLIEQGFLYGGNVFSASTAGQLKWAKLYYRKDAATYPYDVPTKDNKVFVAITSAVDVTAMYDAMSDMIRGHINSGTALKKSAEAATSIPDVEAVLDTR